VSAEAFGLIHMVAGVTSLLVGITLMIAPKRMLRERTGLRRWLLEVDLVALLDRRRGIERPLYRHHSIFGATVFIGGIALLFASWELEFHPWLMNRLSGILGAWGLHALVVTSWMSAISLIVIGAILLIRPSALKPVENAANRWIELFPRAAASSASHRQTSIIRMVEQSPRLVATVLLIGGLAALLAPAAPRVF
jgi:hypothetical protein